MMDSSTIKFKTIQFINGIKHLPKSHIEIVQHHICNQLDIEKNDENFQIIVEGIQCYFDVNNINPLINT